MKNSGQQLPKEIVYDRDGKGKSEIKGVKISTPSTPKKDRYRLSKTNKMQKIQNQSGNRTYNRTFENRF